MDVDTPGSAASRIMLCATGVLIGIIFGHLTSGIGDPLMCSLWRCTKIHVTDGVVHDGAAVAPDLKRMNWPLGSEGSSPLKGSAATECHLGEGR